MTTTPTAPRLQMQFKVRTPEFDENLHPRDRKGRFIETGAEVRIWGGQIGTVLRNVGGGKIEVERSDGRKVIVHRNYLTVTASADGGDPIEDEAEAPDVPVEEASPDAEEVPELADGEDQTLPDRGDAPDRLVDTITPGETVNGRTVGEYIDGPAAIDGWVVGFTESGGPIIRTDEGQDWPLLPDAVMAPDPEGPEMPPEFLSAPEGEAPEAEQVSVRDLAPGDRIRREDGTAVTVVEVTDEVNGKVDVMVEAGDGTKPFAITRTPEDTFERATDADPAGSGRIEPKPEVPAPAPEPGPYEDPTAFDDRALAEAIRRFEGSSNALSTDEGRRQYDGLIAERDKRQADLDNFRLPGEGREPTPEEQARREATDLPGDVEALRQREQAEVKPIDSLNPSDSGVFEEYASGREYRASAPLADNMTTLAETEGVDPDDEVTLYRGVAEGDPADGIRPGDFVTTNRQLAQDYAGTGEVVEMQARYGDVLDDTDEPGGEEYIYRPATQEVAPETAAPETQTPEPVETPEQPAQAPEAPALSRRDETAYRNLVRVGSVLVDDEARATMLRDRAQRDSVEVTIAPSADYPDLWEARVAEGDSGEPGPDGMIEEAPSAPIEDADERARTVAERPVDERIAEARALGYEAYIYDEMRAPALNAGVMDLINPNAQPGDADNLAIMEAFTRGYDDAGNDDLAGNLRPPEPPEEGGDEEVPEGAIGAAPSRGRTTTVTLPDGSTAKRTSKSRQYSHVVVVGPAAQEDRTAAFNRRADRLDEQAAKIEAAVETGKVVKRNRGWGKDDPTDFNAYEAELVGTEVPYGDRGNGRVARTRQTGTYREVNVRCNSNGETLVYGDVPEGVEVIREENGQPVVRSRAYVLAIGRDAAASKREQAADLREAGTKPDDESWSVVRWTSSEKLGRSAADGEFSFYRENYGQTVQVMPVDPVEGEGDQTPPAPGPEPDAVTPPTPGPEPEGEADQYADVRETLVDVSGRPDPQTMDEAEVRSEAMDLEQRIDAVVTAIHGYDGEVEDPRPMPPEMAAMRRRYADVRHEQGRIDRATQTGVGREMGDTFAEEEERARTLPDDEFAEALREHRAWPRNNVNTFGVERARFNGFGAGARQREENGGAFEPREWRARGEEQAPAPTPGPEPEGAEETVRRNPDELQPGDVIVDGAGDRWTVVSRDSEDDTGITFTIRGTAGNEMEQRYARGDRMNVVPAPDSGVLTDDMRLARLEDRAVQATPTTSATGEPVRSATGIVADHRVRVVIRGYDGSETRYEVTAAGGEQRILGSREEALGFMLGGEAPEGGGDRPDPVVIESPGGPRYGRSVTDLRPGDRVHTQGGNLLRERLVGAEATASAGPSGGTMFPFGNQVRTIDRIEGDTIYFQTDEQFIGGGQRTASIEEFRGTRDAMGRTNPDRHVLVDPPEEAAPAPGPEPTPQPTEVPRLSNQKNAAKWITEQAGVSDDPEMVAAVTAALGTRIGRVQGLYPSEGWDRIKASGNADLMAMTQAAHGGITRDVTASGQRRRWDADAARENLTRLRNNDPTLPTVALVGQRAAIDVLDMDAPIRLGQPAATKRVEGIVESVTPEYTWSQRVLIVDDNGERHSAVFASGGKMPSLADPDGVGFDHPARAISNGDPDPVRFTYMRNPESLGATTPGSEFGQDVEPAGRYLNVADEFSARMARERGWETGEVQFQHPLHMDFGGGYGEEDNWKRRLSAHYDGLTGQALADAVRADGYDAIMTNDAYGDSEVVDLSNGAAEVTPDPDATPSASGLDDRWQATGGGLYRATVADLREGDVIYTEGEGTSASPVALPRNPQTGYLSDYQKRQRTVARVDGSGRARTVHFTDGTSTGPEGGDANGATYSGQAPVFGVPERDREAPAPTPPVTPPVITRQTFDGPNGTLTEGDVVARDLRGSVVLERLVAIGPQSVTIRATDGHDEGYPIYGEGDLDRILGKYRPATPEEVARFEGTDADLRSLITPLPDLSADPAGLDDEAIATAIKGIDDNIVTTPEGSDERRNLLVYRARLVGEQNRRASEGTDVDTTTPVETEAVSARDLAVGDKVIFEDGTLATIEGIEPADDLLELEYRDADGLAGSYFTDPGTSVQRLTVGGEPAPDLSPEPEQNPEPAVERTQQVLGGNLAPGDRVWLGRDKVEVLAVEPVNDDVVNVTFRFADRRTETAPFGREAVLDRADDEFLPDPSPLDKTVATSRPVLYTYQRRNIVALGLDSDADPMVAEAARRIRMRQPLAAAHSAALAGRLAEMANSRGVKPQRQRMLLRLAAANNAASIEAGGRGVDLPEMPNAASVTKGRPADAGVGDQIAFVGLRGVLVQGRVVESRSMMSGRLTEVTVERPDGTTEKHMLTRRSDVYVLPDLPEPTPVPTPSGDAPELVEYGSLRVGDRIRIPNTNDLFDDERHLTEATVVEAGQSEGLAYAVLNVHSVMSTDEEQREVLTIDPRMQGIPPHVIRVARGTESADQPRTSDLPPMDPTDVAVEDVAVGDWIATTNRNVGTTDGIVVEANPVLDEEGNRVGTRFALRRPGANFGSQPSWNTVMHDGDTTITRLIASDQNTILRIAEEKRRRARLSREAGAARSIESVLEDYNSAMHFRVVQNALRGGGIEDEHYGDAIWQAFTGGQDATTSLDNDRLRAIGKLTTALQGHLSGEHSGEPGFNGVREAAAQLAEKIVHDHHFRIQTALMNVRPTTPGETRATAGIALARSIFNPDNWGAPAMEQRDLNALARGVVNAREAREGATPDVDRTPAPALPDDGTSLRARMAAYKNSLSSRFGFTDSTVTTFGDFDLDSLERGEVPELTTTTARSKDRANDGGPGESTMAELDTVKAAGADLAAAIDQRLAEESPDLTTAAYDALYNQRVEANRAYEEASTRRNEEYKAAQTRAARERGYVNYQQMEQTVYRRQDPPEGKTYEDVRADFTALRESVHADPTFKAADTASNEAYQGYRTLDQQLRDLKAKMAEARANATRSVLSEVRDMGGLQLRYNSAGRKNYETTTNPLRNGETMKAMRYAETNYPREWLDALNNSPKGALAIGTSKRGFFQGGIWIIRLSKDDNRNNESGWVPPRGRVATHELGHAMETVIPGLSQSEEAFLWSRTSEGEVGSRQRTKRKRIDSSTSYLDDFKESYSGKDYADGTHYELFTTGMETLFAGSDYVDEDYRNWLLGTLALL